MEFLSYVLPLILAYPVIVNRLGSVNPGLRKSRILFVGPLVLIGITVFSYVTGKAVEFLVLKAPSYSVGLKIDVLSGLISATVLTIGVVVSRFSVKYLDDDPKRETFLNNLSFTLSCVLSMLMAPNLVLLFLSWMGTSYFLHKLLTHFSARSGALKAANQKFWISRLGDSFLFLACVLLYFTFNSFEFDTVFQSIKDPLFLTQNNLAINVISILLVLGAMTKSAQFPFHFWLPNTMETPTPVSALMHAGIINAGGYLMVRMSPFLAYTQIALSILALVGGFTAFWAFIHMLAQTDVKRSLAYSTISQMGFMMLQCGLGAFSIAVIHIIGHAFYKAYAFLSSGTATDFGRLNRYFPKPKLSTNPLEAFVLAILSISVVFGGAIMFGFDVVARPGISVLLMVLSLAVAQIVLSSKDKSKSIAAALGILAVYLGLSKVMTLLLFESIPQQIQNEGTFRMITFIICTIFFISLYLIQNSLEIISNTKFGKKMYVKALTGAGL